MASCTKRMNFWSMRARVDCRIPSIHSQSKTYFTSLDFSRNRPKPQSPHNNGSRNKRLRKPERSKTLHRLTSSCTIFRASGYLGTCAGRPDLRCLFANAMPQCWHTLSSRIKLISEVQYQTSNQQCNSLHVSLLHDISAWSSPLNAVVHKRAPLPEPQPTFWLSPP